MWAHSRFPAIELEPGGGHNMATWRALVPPLLEWMTSRLVGAERHPARAVLGSVPLPMGSERPAG